MRKLFVILALFFAVPAMADEFLSAFEEIPVMKGLKEAEPFSFDTESVRIIEQYVSSSTVSTEEFLDFYKATLESLGWALREESSSALMFRREDEALSVSVKAQKPLVAQFSLTPWVK